MSHIGFLSLLGLRGAKPPTVVSISPDVGDYSGLTPVTITGTNFTGATGATIGGIAITSLVVVNSTTITGVTQAHAKALNQSVVVTTPFGVGTLTNAYEYFNPTSLSNCIWWLRADLSISQSGGRVDQWNDNSGSADTNRNVTPFGADRPLYNTGTTVYNNQPFIGPFRSAGPNNNRRLRTGVWSVTYTGDGTTAITMGVIGHAITSGNRYFLFNAEANYLALVNTSGTARCYAGNAAATTLLGGTGYNTAPGFGMAEFNGASSRHFSDALVTPNASGTLSSSTLGASSQFIGSYIGTDVSFGVDGVGEIFAYSRILTDPEKVRMRKYLNGRYNKTMTT